MWSAMSEQTENGLWPLDGSGNGGSDDVTLHGETPGAIDSRHAEALVPPPSSGGGIAARAIAARGGPQSEPPDYLEGLNPEQREAIEQTEGPLLVLAGAGTGKTRVLTTRIAHILATRRAWPSQILAVTFTNKAAREMKERIGRAVGEAVEGMPWLGTFHSIGVKMLRRHAELVGLKSGFTILDTDDQIRLLKQLIQAERLDDKRWPARQLAHMIDGWKNKALTPKEISEGDAQSFGNGKGRKLYHDYQQRLVALNAADFGDLIMLPIRILRENADVLADYQRRFRYMLVDEYQDTNAAQYVWLRLLAQRDGENPNICCVGDDDQSIYGWRGAEVDNILRFEKDFPGAKVIRLERNYRSTQHILGAAAHLIGHNEGRLGKTLFPAAEVEDALKVHVHAAWDSEEEARAIGEEIESRQREGQNLDDIAILVRASFQMREFEDRFVTMGLPYRVIGGPRFYERREIRDALAYFRATVQPADDLAFERIVNVPKRGLGDTSIKAVHDYARRANLPLLAAASEIVETEELKGKARASLREVVSNFRRWAELAQTTPHTELAETILEESGYTDMWKADKAADAPTRLENLKELVRAMGEYESMRGFLEHVSLVMDAESAGQIDAVSIMTLHSAKGLEFGTVYLPGWEEGLFPHQRSLDEGGRSGLEEERRLAYVAITRAKRRAHIWFVSNRRIHGKWQSTIPSRFLDELPEAHVEVVEGSSYGGYGAGGMGAYGHMGGFAQGRGGGPGGIRGVDRHRPYGESRFDRAETFDQSYRTPGWNRARQNQTADTHRNWGNASGGAIERPGFGESGPRGHTIEGELVVKSVKDGAPAYDVGDRVAHKKFGPGTVTMVEGNKLTISFDHAGQKRVLDGFVSPVESAE